MYTKNFFSTLAVVAVMNNQVYALPINGPDSLQGDLNSICLQLLEDNCLNECISIIPDEVINFQTPLGMTLSQEQKDCLKSCVRTNIETFESQGCFLESNQAPQETSEDSTIDNTDHEENEGNSQSRKRRNETSCTEIGGYWT
eukprot:Awhi_evm1s4509